MVSVRCDARANYNRAVLVFLCYDDATQRRARVRYPTAV